MKLERLKPGINVNGLSSEGVASVINVAWHGQDAVALVYRTITGRVAEEILFRADESRLIEIESENLWGFTGDGGKFRLVAEAYRIRLAYLFDPLLAVHISQVEPLPHQITAVYEAMLPRQPLRFLLADDPGAGKTIMAGLFIRELMARGDLKRCLIVCPGSLAEQWQDELYQRFHLSFSILTNESLQSSRSGNWFVENDLVIARLDKLSRNEDVQAKLKDPDCRYDLIVCDEAHKLSATFFGGEIKYTKRYRLGELLSEITRHFLLMTATPHNGREEDFQLFMALLDKDRFEGRFRQDAHQEVDASDMMRRMTKESLLKFDGRPLFPERIAYTLSFHLSKAEAHLYEEVTRYVRDEFNRAEKLQNDGCAGTIGFALTILQRRLASSPDAIFLSLRRRRERLERRYAELENIRQAGRAIDSDFFNSPYLSNDDLEDLDDAPEGEIENAEVELLDQATAARTLAELQAEIETLKQLEILALNVRRSGQDTKWHELSQLLNDLLIPSALSNVEIPFHEANIPPPAGSQREKLVIFTEHRDTLNYLRRQIASLLGKPDAVEVIHGGMGRDARRNAQNRFLHDPMTQVLLATDAAGEGINLQRAHFMVNYDLPWNPNRLEQRFGRIHRIGQTEVCYLWNLAALDTREGDVYHALLRKLDQARHALGGRVFDVLGQLQFEGKSLRELMIEAIRYGERPEVRDRLNRAIEDAVDREHLENLLDEKALANDVMTSTRVARVREDMERAEARRLQPHYIESFFLKAFENLGGAARPREQGRYEITYIPAALREYNRAMRSRERIQQRYERIAFDKKGLNIPGKPIATFVCPGHPLLDTVIEQTLDQYRETFREGAIMVDERDPSLQPRVLFFMEHSIQDDRRASQQIAQDERRVISRQILFVEMDSQGVMRPIHYAPYLDYRPLAVNEPKPQEILGRPECSWISSDLEQRAMAHVIAKMAPEHMNEVRQQREYWIAKTRAAVHERLIKEIAYWDNRAQTLKAAEQEGKPGAKLNSVEAERRADDLQARLKTRMAELDAEARLSALAPVALGRLLIVPAGLLAAMAGKPLDSVATHADTQEAAARARAVVLEIERELGFVPTDREFDRLGYDIESRNPATGQLRFIEVKGRISGAEVVTVTKNEILYSLNKPDDYILALVEFLPDGGHRARYVRTPFAREPDFDANSVNYDFEKLLAKSETPN